MPHNGGKYQTNVFLDALNGDSCINFMKTANHEYWSPVTTSGTTEQLIDPPPLQLMNAQGYPTQAPPSPANVWLYKELYARLSPGEQVLLRWTGTAVLQLEVNVSLQSSSANRRIYTTTNSSTTRINMRVRMTTFGTCSDLLVCRLSEESLWDAGEVLVPALKEYVSGWGWLRFMDPQNANSSYGCEGWERTPEDHCNWVSAYPNYPTKYKGTATNSGYGSSGYTKWIVPAPDGFPASPLYDGQSWFVTFPDYIEGNRKIISNCTIGTDNKLHFECASHGLVDGQIVAFENQSNSGKWDLIARGDEGGSRFLQWTVIVEDTNNFTVEESHYSSTYSTWGTYPLASPHSFYIVPTIQVNGDATEYFPCTYEGKNFTPKDNLGKPVYYKLTYDEKFGRIRLQSSPANTGWPFETLLKIAKDAGAHPWFCLSVRMTYDGWVEILTLIKNWIDANAPWMVPVVEVGNETWNTAYGFQCYAIVSNWAVYSGVSSEDANSYYGYLVTRMADARDEVWGTGGSSRCEVYLGWHSDNYAVKRLQATNRFGSNASQYPEARCDCFGAASYLTPSFLDETSNSRRACDYPGLTTAIWQYKQGGAQRITAFEWLRDEYRFYTTATGYTGENRQTIEGRKAGYYSTAVAVQARQPGKRWMNYEGGSGVYGPHGSRNDKLGKSIVVGYPVTTSDATIDSGAIYTPTGEIMTQTDAYNFLQEFRDSDEFADVYTEYATEVEARNGVPSQYVLEATWGTGTTWGLIQPNRPVPITPAYTAFKAMNAGTPPEEGDPTSWTAVCTL